MDWLTQIEFWHWWILAVLLVIVEIFAPGAMFMWMGISAGLVGLALLVFPGMGPTYQLLIFAVLSVSAIVAAWKYFRRRPLKSDHPHLNRRGEQYVGRTFTLSNPIVNGVGKIRVDDSSWKVSGPDLAAGKRITVVAVNGTILEVTEA